jgi:UDP-N-acetylglucosamine--dolichyl-phosphate N-acetylglucosaminephosphotransferase
MSLADTLGEHLEFRGALILGYFVAALVCVLVMPRAIRKLLGAGIVGKDRHKPGRPEVAEMGGLAVFLAFNAGVFSVLGVARGLALDVEGILLALVVITGATMAGILDDLIDLRQKFKTLISFAFALPLALFVEDYTVWFPVLGTVDLGLAYPVLLVPVAVACASNGFNMLEGFNGLGTGLGIVSSTALIVIALLSNNLLGLAILGPLAGALVGFWFFNAYPARVFPGDTMTLMVGAALACGAILSKLEFWAGLLLLPQIIEFAVKARSRFPTTQWGGALQADGRLVSERTVAAGLCQWVMLKAGPGGIGEKRLVWTILGAHMLLSGAVVAAYVAFR